MMIRPTEVSLQGQLTDFVKAVQNLLLKPNKKPEKLQIAQSIACLLALAEFKTSEARAVLSYCLGGKGHESLTKTVVQSCSDWFCWFFCSGLFVCLVLAIFLWTQYLKLDLDNHLKPVTFQCVRT